MVKIYLKILVLALPAFILVIIVGNVYSKGFIDYYYNKITADGKSMIVGTSRSSQGIRPDEIMRNTNFEGPMLNFAMSSFDSPYSESYYNAICSKIDKNAKNGLFIIEIEPQGTYQKKEAQEQSHKLDLLLPLNSSPNYEYLYRNINPYYKLIQLNNITFPTTIQHSSGWLEVKLKLDSSQIKKSSDSKYKSTEPEIAKLEPSTERWDIIKKTIDNMKRHGKVFLVRLPAENRFIELENNYLPDFNSRINSLAKEKNVKYLDLTYLNNECTYIDGNHLDSASSLKISKLLNQLIQQ